MRVLILLSMLSLLLFGSEVDIDAATFQNIWQVGIALVLGVTGFLNLRFNQGSIMEKANKQRLELDKLATVTSAQEIRLQLLAQDHSHGLANMEKAIEGLTKVMEELREDLKKSKNG